MAINPIVPVRKCPVCGNWTTDFGGLLWRTALWPFRTPTWRRQHQEAGKCALCGLPLKDDANPKAPDDHRVL